MFALRLQLILLLATTSPAVFAEDVPNPVFLGIGAWVRPAYDGASTSRTVAIPAIRFYGQPWFARSTFGMLEGGMRAELLNGLTLGGQFAYEGGRESSESEFLLKHAFTSLSPSLSWGMHAELEKKIGPMPFIALLRYRQDIDTERGAQADLRLTAGLYSNLGLNAGIFAQTTWANSNAANYYFGITTQQAATSSLPYYELGSGPLFNSAGLLWSYDLHQNWILLGSLETRMLRSGPLDSPLVQDSTSRYISLGLAYQY